jgi:hypothetical protein
VIAEEGTLRKWENVRSMEHDEWNQKGAWWVNPKAHSEKHLSSSSSLLVVFVIGSFNHTRWEVRVCIIIERVSLLCYAMLWKWVNRVWWFLQLHGYGFTQVNFTPVLYSQYLKTGITISFLLMYRIFYWCRIQFL